MSDKETKAELKAAKAKEKAMRPWYKKKRFILLGIIGLLVVINVARGGSGDSDITSTSSTSSESTSGSEAAEAEEDSSSLSETISQFNAKRSADSYLDNLPFSRKGLIEQLEFEGFSEEDATYAVDAINADWKEQAARSAESYLDSMSFSRKSLIEQLEFDGYTPEEAEYGVSTTGL